MKRTLAIGLAAAVLLAGLLVALPFLIPLSAYRSQIEARATAAIGRTVRIEGPLRISFFPVLGLKAENVTLANLAGGAHPYLAQVDTLEIGVAFAPLLKGEVDVTRIRLVHPQIHLEVDRAGGVNWSVGPLQSSPHSSGVSRVRVADVAIEDGTVTYSNAKSNSEHSLDHLSADLHMSISGHLTSRGTFDQRGHPIQFAASLAEANAAPGVQAPVHVDLTSAAFQAHFTGRASNTGDMDGNLSLDTASLHQLADLVGHPLAATNGLGHFKLNSRLSVRGSVFVLPELALTLESITAQGHLTVDARGEVPNLSGALTAARLDLNPFLGATQGEGREPGWSKRPIALSFLEDANADLSLTAASLTLRRLKVENASIAVKLSNGILDAALARFALYGGQGTATLHADATGPMPLYENRFSFSNIQMAPFLADTIGVGRIEGTGIIRLEVSSRGDSANDIMHALNGKGAVTIRSGAVHGVDLGLVARTVQSVLSGGATSAGATTQFSNLGGTFSVRNGLLDNRDFALSGPVITATGHGQLDLGARTIDFHLVPKAGLGGSALAFAVPIRITGTWDQLHYSPDLAGAVGGVLGGVAEGGSSLKHLFLGDSKQKKSNVGDSVKSLFGIH